MPNTDMLSLADWGNSIKGADAKALYSETVMGFYDSDCIITHGKIQTAPIVTVDVPFASQVVQPTTVGLGQALGTKTIDIGGHQASIFLMGDYFQVDRLTAQQPGTLGDPLKSKWDIYVKGACSELNRQWIKGNPGTNVKEFAGWAYRFANPETFKLRNDLTNPVGTAGTPLDCTSAVNAASARKLVRAIETGFAALQAPDGEGCHIYGNQQFMGSFPDICGVAGRNLMIQDGKEGSYGYRRKSFGRAGLHDLGFDHTGAAILPNDASDGTDLWIVNWKNLAAWQTNLMKIMPDAPKGPHDNYWFRYGFGVGEKTSYPVYRIRFVKFV
jgi:hypothetical protein